MPCLETLFAAADKSLGKGALNLNSSWARNLTALSTLLAGAVGAAGQSTPDPSSLADQSLDQLLNTPVVTVSKRAQPLSKAPAAVFVITREDIHRSGATSIPEVLRLAPGVQVARITATQWAVSIRGFDGLWSNKLLVLIDGRTIYSEIFSGVDWEMQDVILDDIDRIEVVRGPGSSVWGANAMNGVINIVTRQAQATPGARIKVSGGNLTYGMVSAQYGGSVGQTSFRVYAKMRDESLPLYGDETYGDRHADGVAGFRVDSNVTSRDTLTLQGDGYAGQTTDYELHPVTLPNFQPAIANVDGRPSSFDVTGKWTRTLSDTSQMSLQVFGTHTDRSEYGIDAKDATFDVEFQHSFAIGSRNSILWGLEERSIGDQITGSPVFYFSPERRSEFLTAGFISDDITLVPDRLILSAGTKLEKYSFTSAEPEPSANLAWTPNDSQTVWASVGRAVRIPSRFELDIRLDAQALPGPIPGLFQIVGNPDAASETMVAYQAGHRIKLGNRVSLDTALFYNHYGTLRSTQLLNPEFVPGASPYLVYPLQYNQLDQGSAMGIENTGTWSVRSNWRLTSAYSFGVLSVAPKPGNNSVNNIYQDAPGSLPKHQAQIHSYWDINSKLQLDAGGRYVDRLPAQGLPAYTTADVRLGWRLNTAVELNVAVNNIFNDVHAEWLTNDDLLYRGLLFGRTANASLVWQF